MEQNCVAGPCLAGDVCVDLRRLSRNTEPCIFKPRIDSLCRVGVPVGGLRWVVCSPVPEGILKKVCSRNVLFAHLKRNSEQTQPATKRTQILGI